MGVRRIRIVNEFTRDDCTYKELKFEFYYICLYNCNLYKFWLIFLGDCYVGWESLFDFQKV